MEHELLYPEQMDYQYLTDLQLFKPPATIKVKILRIWKSTTPDNSENLLSLDFLIADAKDHCTHHPVQQQEYTLIHKFQKLMNSNTVGLRFCAGKFWCPIHDEKTPVLTMILELTIEDLIGKIQLLAFGQQAEKLIGATIDSTADTSATYKGTSSLNEQPTSSKPALPPIQQIQSEIPPSPTNAQVANELFPEESPGKKMKIE
ncbi:PREDICTED: uncharacterized protein LOC18596401 [Theobroma cacao]|uniref:Uncharacterized protein LOC18596401 n=1 Tax=Theobroma cacao TaxID=3641 RepID=A0AB32WGN6_THECC|nr:PREDICTED: uncharacterized protein LOC18596401 [Theobroma cacao]